MKKENKDKVDFRNFETIISGKLSCTIEEGTTIFHLQDAKYWSVPQQKWLSLSNDPDKFQTQDQDYNTAKEEFWFRFKLYIKNRFKRYIPTEITYI